MGALSDPALADDLLLAISFPDSGVVYRIAQDGRYFVGDEQKPPVSEMEPGAQVLSEEALVRLRAALDEDGFFDMPEQVPPGDVEGVVLPGGGHEPRPRPVVIAARGPDGQMHTVAGAGDPRAPWTFGRLAHVWETVDREALGGWLNE